MKSKLTVKYLTSHIIQVFGIVLVWRGIWHLFDEIDKIYFGGSHIFTAIVGIIIGIVILYVPDHNLKELEQH